ncbi:homeobox protein ATH1 isoform X2 [Rhododendron vialii]|uniref:homeobox protein ATH1 isoform X2 n=1 Tax=Rhododendron vialii TaxID=182163 RepID=UPI00265D6815|nr:homeobox protein ATH1 isoform X2 [Rhododendron vialii]
MSQDMGDQNTMLDGMFSHITSLSSAQSGALHQNNQRLIMSELPALAMLEGEPMINFYGGSDSSIPISNPSCPVENTQFQEGLVSGISVSSEFGNSAPSPYPLEILRATMPNDFSAALNSAFTASVNYGYGEMIGGTNSKWTSDKFLDCPELYGKVTGRTGIPSFPFMGNTDTDGWISSENTSMSPANPSGSSNFNNELSLSLATCQPSFIHGTCIQDQCSEISSSGVTHRSLNGKQLGSETSCKSKNLSLSFNSCRPVQLQQFFSSSGYLRVIQEILSEIASYSLESLVHENYSTSGIEGGAKYTLSSSRHAADRGYGAIGYDDFSDGNARFEVQMGLVEAKKKKLLDLLELVDERYNQCVDEIHTVISAFHAATELDPHRHPRFALQTISSLYKNLRERISSQILKMGASCNKGNSREEDRTFETSFIQKRWALQQLQRKDHQFWRPQRGLPERSVSVLRAWMFQNFLHPYPKDAEKHLLAVRSGLTRSQVSNWFINARVRLWKPMIDEMYAEMNRRKGWRNVEDTDHGIHVNHMSIKPRGFGMK